jgi:hypothetical protein
MIILDFENVQEFVFSDSQLRNQLPKHRHLFDSWILGVRVPAMRQLSKRSVLEFLETIDDEDLKIISDHIGEEVELEQLDYHIVKELNMSCKNVADILNETDCYPNFAITRTEGDVTICFWR